MINIDLWKRSAPYSITSLPTWPCPFCGKEALRPDFKSIKFKTSKRQFDPDSFKMDNFEDNLFLGFLAALSTAIEKSSWVQSRFVGFLDCRSCGDNVCFSGRAEIYKKTSQEGPDHPARLYPEYFSPSLPVFTLSDQYPEDVRKLLLRSFSLLFTDPPSAANIVRRAIELLLDNLEIAKVNSKGKKVNLYNRISFFEESHPELKGILHAIRFVGNEGSHSGGVSKIDLIDSYEIVDYVLDELFLRSKTRSRVRNLSEKMTPSFRNS